MKKLEPFKEYKISSPKINELKIDDQEKFKNYINCLKKEGFICRSRVNNLRIAEFVGKYNKYIEEELSEEIERLGGTTMMVHQERKLGQVTDRKIHVYNAADIAYKIAKGIFKVEDIAQGIRLATLLHDIGQPALGHDGENMSSKVSFRKQGGPRPHNATGATQILYRSSRKIRKAINKGISMEIIKEEAIKRNISIEQLSNNLKDGKEPELENTIKIKGEDIKSQTNAAIEMLAMSAGRHNGERGTANILPNYEITFDDFNNILKRCFVYEGADKEMQSANMIDAIVKISDQISSIPYDIIDGKKGGLVIDIPTDYAEPISQILGIEKQQILERLKGNNAELNTLVIDIQEKLIGNLIENSSKEMIKLNLDSWLYGKKDRITGKTIALGLRMPTYSEYLPYTSGEKEVKVLQEVWYKTVEKLANEILQVDRIFSRKLNAIFRMDENDERRENYKSSLMQQYSGKEEYKDFMNYILDTSPDEYKFIKQNCHEYGINLFREKIQNAKDEFKNGTSQYASSNDSEIEQGILNYIYSSKEGIPEPQDGKIYSDAEIEKIYEEVNNMRSRQGKKRLLLQRDERIAVQLALGYIESTFNDSKFIDFAFKIGTISEDEVKIVKTPYDPVTKSSYISGSLEASAKAYNEAERGI